jgi:hypothetical protein
VSNRIEPNGPSLSELLASAYTVGELKEIASVLGVHVYGRKSEMSQVLAGDVTGRTREFWNRLEPLERNALTEALHASDGRLDESFFRAKYGQPVPWTRKEGKVTRPSPLQAVLPHLYLHPSLRAAFSALAPLPARAELRSSPMAPDSAPLKRVVGVFTGVAKEGSRVPVRVVEREAAAGAELLALLHLLDSGQLPWKGDRAVEGVSLKRKIGAVLVEDDYFAQAIDSGPVRAIGWLHLFLSEGGLILPGPRATLTASGRAALTRPVSETLASLWSAWVRNTVFDEVQRIRALSLQSYVGHQATSPPRGRREAIVAVLRECPVGEWVLLQDFLRYIVATRRGFRVTNEGTVVTLQHSWWTPLGPGADDLLMSRFTACLLLEYASTLGLLDVAIAQPDGLWDDVSDYSITRNVRFLCVHEGLVAFRRTALSEKVLGGRHAIAPSPPAAESLRFVLSSDGTLKVQPLPDSGSGNADLDLFGNRVDTWAWKLGPGTILRGMRHGGSLPSLRELLEKGFPGGVPTVLERSVARARWGGEQLKEVGKAHLYLCASDDLSLMISSHPALRRYCLRCGTRYVAVADSDLEAFHDALLTLGLVASRE